MSTTLSTNLHVEIADPDDPMGAPAYSGPAWEAGAILQPGTYDAAHEGYERESEPVSCQLIVHGDGHTTLVIR